MSRLTWQWKGCVEARATWLLKMFQEGGGVSSGLRIPTATRILKKKASINSASAPVEGARACANSPDPRYTVMVTPGT